MSSFGQMQADMQLLGMASLLNADFGSLINKCQREEVESYPWSFLYQTQTLYSRPVNSQGSITLTQGSTAIVGTGTNFELYNTFSGAPDYAFYLWAGATMTTPVLVQSILTSNAALLSTAWAQPTLTKAPFDLQQLYYPIFPLQTVFRVRQIDLLIETSQAELNGIDPSRIATGGAPCLRWSQAPFFRNTNAEDEPAIDPTNPMIELWPRPSSILPYILEGKTGPVDMVALTDQPMIPSQVLEAKAMMYACRAMFAQSGNPKWMTMSDAYKADYTLELEKAKTEDSKRIIPKGITSWGGRRLFDAAVDCTHDLAGPPGGFSSWT